MYLLDTHYLIWMTCDPDKLSPKAADLITNENNNVYFSAASIFEIEIKKSIGKLDVPDQFAQGLRDSGLEELPILSAHAENLSDLPSIHKDPFDRMLIAQALEEKMILVTQDHAILQYQSHYAKIISC